MAFVDENISPAIKVVKSLQKDWKKDGVEVDFTGEFLMVNLLIRLGSPPSKSFPRKKIS